MTRRRRRLLFVICAAFAASVVEGASVSEENRAADPPLLKSQSGSCKVTLMFKGAVGDDQHGFLVVTRPDGTKTEIRGGPSLGGSGSDRSSGSDQSSSGAQPSGNPFQCKNSENWGVVVPYIGRHGALGKDAKGHAIFSPDGNVMKPNGITPIDKTMDGKSTCMLADCLMTVVKAAGKSCLPYTVGTGELRNSNTIISFALAACGVPDPLPKGISAPGWGGSWEKK
jgi:hypothetical protein